MFEPIAIVGRGCVLPGALDPDAFWDNIIERRVSLTRVPEGRWRLPAGDVPLGISSDVGGYVSGFADVFDPDGLQVDAARIGVLDESYRWVLHGARQALGEAGVDQPHERAGLVLGNLSLPTDGMVRFAESVWLSDQTPAVRAVLSGLLDGPEPSALNRFSSGIPAHFAAAALGLGAGSFALDAACASSLYAIKLACDRLHDGTADLMVAGAVNRTDDLAIHQAFSALSALSPTGRSRPFHRDADGLVPAEGAAFVALMRLSDALAAGVRIRGVIRGVGLSNDGRSKGILVPTEEGQVRALQQAYADAEISPESVSLLECHATGTSLGDAVEVRSTSRAFAGARDLPIGSAKSNTGHLITAAGAAGVLKVLAAMDAGIRPPTLGADEPVEALRDTPLRLLHEAEAWDGHRRAGISAFGFGGNNAHLVLEQWTGDNVVVSAKTASNRSWHSRPDEVAIVGIGARVADCADFDEFRDALLCGTSRLGPAVDYAVAVPKLRVPPADLQKSLGQQVSILEAAREAVRDVSLVRDRTMVLIGMGCDVEVARYPTRTRVASNLGESEQREQYPNAFAPVLDAPAVVGTMPNVVANRINAQLDLAGPSFTVSAEEASGLVALEIGERALRSREADAVLVGAVDLSHEQVHRKALADLNIDVPPGDAAVVLVLKRLDDARRDGDDVLAVLTDPQPDVGLVVGDGAISMEIRDPISIEIANQQNQVANSSRESFDPAKVFGVPHAAKGLLAVACAAVAVRHGAIPRVDQPADPSVDRRSAAVAVSTLGAQERRLGLRADSVDSWIADGVGRLHVFSGADAATALAAARAGRETDTGPARLVVRAADHTQLHDRIGAAERWLAGQGLQPEGVAFRNEPIVGEAAFVFSNGSASYSRMGREVMLALPDIRQRVEQRCGSLAELIGWAYAGTAPRALDQIWGASVLGQLHTEITRGLLGVKPTAVIGYSSGESSALVAMGAWRDVPRLVAEVEDSVVLTSALAGEFAAVRRAWRRHGVTGEKWAAYIVSASAEAVREAVAGEPAVHLMAMNAPGVSVLGGESEGCQRVLRRLGQPNALPLDYDIAAHVPEVDEVRHQYWELHRRPTFDLPDVRFYSCATTEPYLVTAQNAADAVTAQAVGTIDFIGTVERAWRDGVRVFIEHGPRGLCTGWIQRILGDREHVAVALDSADGRSLRQLTRAVAELVAAGVIVDHERLLGALATGRPAPRPVVEAFVTEAHPPPIVLPEPHAEQRMHPAPALPPVGELLAPVPDPAGETLLPVQTPAPVQTPVERAAFHADGEWHRIVASTHQEFLESHAQVHQQYLALLEKSRLVLMSRPGTPGRGEVQGTVDQVRWSEAPFTQHPTGQLSGPIFGREQLVQLASGRISEVFGPEFRAQDGFRRQVRMPQPPMLLADRVTGIDAPRGRLGTGTIWTQTDVTADAWYLDPTGRMPAGLMIEAGQADLLLISWMGVDLLNRGERVYRLLGCELTFHGSPPAPGEVLDFDIHIDGHGDHGGTRLFFFHYDCRVDGELRLSVRGGQAGFFSDHELADTSGVLWDPAGETPEPARWLDEPQVVCSARSFSAEQVAAFAAGRPDDCFGPEWLCTQAHVRTPRIAGGKMLLLREVTEFDPAGGPWKRGYLRAETPVSADDWFFEGHFKDDPCMPGTLMYEGCLQAMAFYLAALGHTVDADGWRFEPVTGDPVAMRCRGQVTPDSRSITYEVFVTEVSAGPVPTLTADVLCTVDGVKAFHARRVGLRLVPDWPLATLVPFQEAEVDSGIFGRSGLLASAWGKPTDAFGPAFAPFDGVRRSARLPGPPYHFISRIVSVGAPQGAMTAGGHAVAEYDLPADAWYWAENGYPVMPLAVLMEVALQPCGWFASYAGCTLSSEEDFLFRNLDGSATILGEVNQSVQTLRTTVTLLNISRYSGTIIVSFDVDVEADGQRLLHASSVFGFFPAQAFAEQIGLPSTRGERLSGDSCRELLPYDGDGSLRLAGPMLLVLDRITGYWPDGGKAGLGRVVAEKDVRPGEWYFKAHFFQDPVQPGSLGVEAMCQLLRFYMIDRGLGDGVTDPRFSLVTDRPLTWKYRGQVTPANQTVTVELDVLELGEDPDGRFAVADASLWVDGARIYHVPELALRVVEQNA
ncbi:beta-ketoacyl synthase N-terminal-like domain-containing protein [Saccharopolyspora pogona]|uniref:beta-ketoacyl synthase N-terminal-like domain-containing protein n=1 Tax=Saccharopolyspora pogona TaxID=333966 RepID=UPI0016897CD9|nr:beta-ketoacyl synthase N-terminal-like domain-containing protein [Saccharopolyspora pogona]